MATPPGPSGAITGDALDDFHSLGSALLKRLQSLAGLVEADKDKDKNKGKVRDANVPDIVRDVENKLNTLVKAVSQARDQAKVGLSPDDKKLAQPSIETQLRFVPQARAACQDISAYFDGLPAKADAAERITLLRKLDQDEEFHALAKRLIDGADDFSILEAVLSAKDDKEDASKAALSHLKGRNFYHVHLNRVHDFVGQQDILADLEAHFSGPPAGDKTPTVAVLCGMGGQGKTQIALEYCQTLKEGGRYAGIFWVDASSKTSTERGMEEISDLLKADDQAFVDMASRIAFAREALSGWDQSWLLVFDNHDSPLEFNVEEFFPRNHRGNILVTSRSHHTRKLGKFIELIGMLQADALDLFFTSSKAQRDEIQEWHAKNIIVRLGVLPLAIHQAGAYLSRLENAIALEDFLPHYEKHKLEVMAESHAIKQYLDRTASAAHSESAKSVFTTWSMAFQLLKPETDAGARKVDFLNLLGFFDEFDISEKLFENYVARPQEDDATMGWAVALVDGNGKWSADKFKGLMSELLDLSLITFLEKREDGYWHFSLHPLVKDWIRIRQEKEVFRRNVALASKILAMAIMEHFWTLAPDSQLHAADVVSNSMGFAASMDVPTKTSFFAHLAAWRRNFDEVAEDSTPTYFHTNGHGEMASELCFGIFFIHYSLCNDAHSIARWLWDKCQVDTTAGIRTKAVTGGLIAELHMAMRKQVQDLMAFSRENLDFWLSHPDVADVEDLIWNARYVLVVAMEHQGIKEVTDEGAKICREVLMQEHPRNFLFELELADFISRSPRISDHDPKIINLYKAVVHYDRPHNSDNEGPSPTANPNWRMSRIGYRQWTLITKICRSWISGHSLVMEMIAAMRQHFGDNHVFTYAALMRGAMSWLDRGNRHQALNITSLCVANLRRSPPHDGILFNALRLHGDILYMRSQMDEALLCYREGLRELEKVEQGVKGFDGYQLLWRLADCLKVKNEKELAMMAYRSILSTERDLGLNSTMSIIDLCQLLRETDDPSHKQEAVDLTKKLMDTFLELAKNDPDSDSEVTDAESDVATAEDEEITYESPRFLFNLQESCWGYNIYMEHAEALVENGQDDAAITMVTTLANIVMSPDKPAPSSLIRRVLVLDRIRIFSTTIDENRERAVARLRSIADHMNKLFPDEYEAPYQAIELRDDCLSDVEELLGDEGTGAEAPPSEESPSIPSVETVASADEETRVSRARRFRNRLSALIRRR